ncbi:hypothetical protein BCR35DRAFT_353059 [Leucosporidium creatinivorum]|uniref:MYND-type domain-containing protein n=1 Tax=Leucosporidium creatinivorum TaxID=106004 RepID=A0A1Y2F2I5_9BASI|nr:hypothetical protein BCR35DRAFT_353059 [Leucosporidium creatinivorum]
MPFKLQQRTLSAYDPLVRPKGDIRAKPIPTPPNRSPHLLALHASSYALLGPESPKRGVIAHLAGGTTIIATRCEATKRLSVADVDSGGNHDFSSYSKQFGWLAEDKCPAMEIVFIHSPSCPPPLAALQPTLRALAEPLGVSLSFSTQELPSGISLQIDRNTSTITSLNLAPGTVMDDPIATVESHAQWKVQTRRSCLTPFQTDICKVLDGGKIPIWEQFDGKQLAPLPTLSDTARTTLKILTEGQMAQTGSGSRKAAPQGSAIMLTLPQGRVDRRDPKNFVLSPMEQLQMGAMRVVSLGAACVVCGETEGISKCASCEWEPYCGSRCQKQDWPAHKGWCKKNRRSSKP